jgi:hypothetical protein
MIVKYPLKYFPNPPRVRDNVPVNGRLNRRVDDRHPMLKEAGDWVELGGAGEQKPPKKEPSGLGAARRCHLVRSEYLPPLLEEIGLCELEHNPRNNRVRAK